MQESDLQYLDIFKQQAKQFKECYSEFSENNLMVLKMMFQIVKTTEAYFEENMALNGMVSACWPVLMMIYIADEQKIIATDISCALLQNKSTTSRVIDSLIEKSLLTREQDNEDRRKIYLKMTNQGKEYVKSLMPKAASFHSTLFASVDLEILLKEIFKIWINAKHARDTLLKK